MEECEEIASRTRHAMITCVFRQERPSEGMYFRLYFLLRLHALTTLYDISEGRLAVDGHPFCLARTTRLGSPAKTQLADAVNFAMHVKRVNNRF